MTGVLMLSHDEVRRALPPVACAEAVAAILAMRARGQAHVPLRSVMQPAGAVGLMGLMPAWRASGDGASGDGASGDGAAGAAAAGAAADGAAGDGAPGGGDEAAFALKAVCVMPDNPARGLDAHQGLVILFDGRTGTPTAILDASAVTDVRTAAVTAVATRALARENSRVLAILGAGVQARSHLSALLAVRPFEAVRVFAPTAEHARAVVAEADATDGIELTVAASAERAVRGADVVVTVTNARRPVLERAWLAPGAHINAVGASAPSAWELDVATVAACALYCDSRESLVAEAGEYRLAVQEGAIDGDAHVRAELGEVLIGHEPGRRDGQEITLFRSLGLGIEDLAAAECAVANARRLGIGTEVRL